MEEALSHLSTSVAIFIVIVFSFYMVRNTRGRMSEAFKIIIFGHLPMMILHTAESLMIIENLELSEIKMVFLELTAQVIAALSIFIAIYIIRQNSFHKMRPIEHD